MAENASDSLRWLLQLPEADVNLLAGIRHWEGLQLARAENAVWLRGFTNAQIKHPTVQSLPQKSIWLAREGGLFREGHLVPLRSLSALEWQDLKQVLPLELPEQNFNFFGIRERLPIQLVRTAKEEPVVALLLPLETLGNYIQTAPTVRLKELAWTVLKGQNALVVGTPVLPLPGQAFWKRGTLLLPAGWDFQWPALAAVIAQKHELEAPHYTCLWEPAGNRTWMAQTTFQMLSIGSFRQTVQQISVPKKRIRL